MRATTASISAAGMRSPSGYPAADATALLEVAMAGNPERWTTRALATSQAFTKTSGRRTSWSARSRSARERCRDRSIDGSHAIGARRRHLSVDVAGEVRNRIPCPPTRAGRPVETSMAQLTKIESSPDRHWRLAHVLQTRGAPRDVEGPMVLEHREALIYTLGKAAELEHLVLCQYLFAAFSLKQGEREWLTPEQVPLVEGGYHTLIQIA